MADRAGCTRRPGGVQRSGGRADARARSQAGARPPRGAGRGAAARRLDVNRLRMWVANDGRLPSDPATWNAGLLDPRAAGLPIVYACGLWLAGTVDGATRLALAEYVS